MHHQLICISHWKTKLSFQISLLALRPIHILIFLRHDVIYWLPENIKDFSTSATIEKHTNPPCYKCAKFTQQITYCCKFSSNLQHITFLLFFLLWIFLHIFWVLLLKHDVLINQYSLVIEKTSNKNNKNIFSNILIPKTNLNELYITFLNNHRQTTNKNRLRHWNIQNRRDAIK